ncbi:MAG TPA: Npt1/Npt2 family nucleotide transporter [Terriglobia bacterium]|nr:Npt1/Npt2 family nucleotide transporter [Terriglobia bacterium]
MASSRLKHWAAQLAPIYPGEGAVVGLCFLVNLLAVAGIMFGRNARDSLFLVYFGVQYLPYMYFTNAVFLILCSLVYTTLVDKIDRGKFLAGVSLIFVASLVVSRVIVSDHPHWFFPVLYNQATVIWYFSLMQFWTFVGDLFDTRQAKRVYPLLAVGALVGMVGVGLGAKPIVHLIGTENLLLLWAGSILAAVILAAITYKRYRVQTSPLKGVDSTIEAHPKKPSEWEKIKHGLREVGQEPLLRSMAGYILLLWTVFSIVDFCFNKTMREIYPNAADLATFFGRFVGIQGLLCLVIQVFFARAVISRLGVGKTINFHPAILVLGSAWMSLRYGFASVFSTKLGDASMLYTFSDSSYQLLYSPISPERRARVRGFIEGYIRPLSLAAAGALVLLGNNYLKPILLSSGGIIPTGQQLAWGALIMAALWLGVALTAQKGYIRALLRNLQGDSPALRLAAETALKKLKEEASVSLLEDILRNENLEQTLAAILIMESFGTEEAAEAIAKLLSHGDPHVRATAVSALSHLAPGKYLDRMAPLLDDPDPRVRSNIIEALAEAKDPALAEKLQPFLKDPSRRIRINTILTIAAIQGVSPSEESWPVISDLASGDQDARSAAVFALGRISLDQSTELLSQLLKDPDLNIRCKAAEALGRVGSQRNIPALVEALAGSPEVRHRARRSIVSIIKRHGGDTVHDVARTALSSERPEIRSEIADVLGRLKDIQVMETLIKLLKDPEWRVRWKVLKSFERMARGGPLPENARTALFDYAHDELQSFQQSVLISQILFPKPSDVSERMLAQALEEDRANIEERVFHMLGILCGRDRMLAIYQKLRSGDARLRADALEALDNLAPKKISRQILKLLEPAPIDTSLKVPPPAPLVAGLAVHLKPWVRACTAYYLGFHSVAGAEGLLRGLCHDYQLFVQETALYAGWQDFKETWRPQIDSALQSPALPLQRCAKRILAEISRGPGEIPNVAGGGEPMLLTVEKVLFLKSVSVFAALGSEELAALADIAEEREFEAGQIIFNEGQAAHHLYILVRGKVEVFRQVDSTEHPIAILNEKESFGEMAILDDKNRSATVRALDPIVVLKIDRESFRELILERPQISFAIFKILSDRLRQSNLGADISPALEAHRQIA